MAEDLELRDDLEMRWCRCVDPEHCREPIPGRMCKAQFHPSAYGGAPQDHIHTNQSEVRREEEGADEIREMIALLKRIEQNTSEALKVQQAIFELLLSRKPL